MKCRKCKGALAGAIAMGIWYIIGVVAIMFVPGLLKIAPQLVFAKELAPAADGMDIIGIAIGLIQVFAMTFAIIYVACGVYGRIEKRKK